MTDAELDKLLAHLRQRPPSVSLHRVRGWVRSATPRRRWRYLTVWLARVGLIKPN
ncbi:hypothetical protein [Lewinella sp. W8]|uniref:hypothetical protein n=1 Tax=Lewinella sp. W8 TaxID=2528208 RepID=UPI0012B50FCC|nr:hypothetical protein [Lewinella sp. W8]MTB50048.1 hypothetical protein [Lewinella sp. W8]